MVTGMLLTIVLCSSDAKDSEWKCFLKALHLKESSGQLTPPDGDNSKAIGPYQIWRSYWIDSRMPGTYDQCRDKEYSEEVVRRYMTRYAKKAISSGDWRTCFRIHNGGPAGAKKRSTIAYGNDAMKILKSVKSRRR